MEIPAKQREFRLGLDLHLELAKSYDLTRQQLEEPTSRLSSLPLETIHSGASVGFPMGNGPEGGNGSYGLGHKEG